MSSVLHIVNKSGGAILITDHDVLDYMSGNYLLTGQTIVLPVSFRTSSPQLNSLRDSGLVEMRVVEGEDPSTIGVDRAKTLRAEDVEVFPNPDPFIQQPNVQRFLDDVELKLEQGGGGGGGFRVEEITLTPTHITTKFVTLLLMPVNSQVSVSIRNGPQQSQGQDYLVTGNNISWAGLGMDGVLSTGDELIIEYGVA